MTATPGSAATPGPADDASAGLVLPDIRAEAERLASAALAAGLPLRLMGGLAVWLASPSVRQPPFARAYADLDFAAASRARSPVKAFFEAQGYVPEKLFNALHGAQRLNYAAPHGGWTIDVIFDELAMSHRLDLRDRLAGPGATIPLADLLLTKLQIWEINDKDLGDALCLLADHAVSPGPDGGAAPGSATPGPAVLDVRRIGAVLGADWGFGHTVERNLSRVARLWAERRPPAAAFDVARQVAALQEAIEAAPKTLGWKARARVGERVRWYETPEEVRH